VITELKVGDYIEKSELDTEQKYNDVVEVFGQRGFVFHELSEDRYKAFNDLLHVNNGWLCMRFSGIESPLLKRKLTYSDIMSLKKVDVDNCNIDKVVSDEDFKPYSPENYPAFETYTESMMKSAVDAMESLGYEYDEDKQQWFKREYL